MYVFELRPPMARFTTFTLLRSRYGREFVAPAHLVVGSVAAPVAHGRIAHQPDGRNPRLQLNRSKVDHPSRVGIHCRTGQRLPLLARRLRGRRSRNSQQHEQHRGPPPRAQQTLVHGIVSLVRLQPHLRESNRFCTTEAARAGSAILNSERSKHGKGCQQSHTSRQRRQGP